MGRQIPLYIKYFIEQLDCKLEIIIWGKTNPMPLYSNKYLGDKEYCLYFRKKGFVSLTYNKTTSTYKEVNKKQF